MRILISPNAMKGSLTAFQFANAIAEGLMIANPDLQVDILPIADGGDGTADILVNYLKGEYICASVHDPIGRILESRFGWIEERKTAIIELADASGMKLIAPEERNPMKASSYGTGELIAAALDRGAIKIFLGLGGSATVDGGVGLLNALGGRILDKRKNGIQPGGEGLMEIDEIVFDQIHPLLANCKFEIITDVSNPLLGQEGAAAVFGPQKGATAEQVEMLEKGLTNLSQIILRQTGTDFSLLPGLGAAGGAALPLVAFWGGKIVPGAEYILDCLEFGKHLLSSDMVFTGEGSIDAQTLNGKGPGVVASRARSAGIPVIALGGSISSEADSAFDALFSVINAPIDSELAMRNAYHLVRNQSAEIGKLIKIMRK